MIDVLYKMTRLLPRLLKDRNGWEGRYYTFENVPRFRILSRKVGSYRVGLHDMDKHDASMAHPHPWPSAALIIQGGYEMYMGFSEDEERPSLVGPIFLSPGSYYEMKKREVWHSVRPLTKTLTLFVFGKKFPNLDWGFDSDDNREDFPELTQSQRNKIFDAFDTDQARKLLKDFKRPKKTKITYYW